MRHLRLPTQSIVLTTLLVSSSGSCLAAADDGARPATTPADQALGDQVHALAQEVQELKRRFGVAEQQGSGAGGQRRAEGVAAPLAQVRANPSDGFLIESLDGSNKLRVGGYLDFDGRYFTDDARDRTLWGSGAANTFYARHARLEISGTVENIFDFRLLEEFAPTQSSNTSGYTQSPVLLDAFIATRIVPALVVTVGQFKSPVGLEYLQYTPNNAFVELGLASNLVPGRDEGILLSGKLAHKTIYYQLGVLNGGVDGTANVYNDVNAGKDGEARVIFSPFVTTDVSWLKDLNLGVAGTYGIETGTGSGNPANAAVTTTALPIFKTTSQLTFFSYNSNAYAKGEHFRVAPQLYWGAGPFSTLDEYMISKQRIAGVGTIDSYVTDIAYQFEVGAVLTGERASYNGVVPRSPVGKGGYGALELVARVNRLVVGNEAFNQGLTGDANITKSARAATAFGIGLNWYISRNVKVVCDYELCEFNGGGGGSAEDPVDRTNESLVVGRFQLAY